MLQAALANGVAEKNCIFEVFTRRLPAWRRYGVFAGGGRLLEQLSDFKFSAQEIDWLKSEKVVDDTTLDYLSSYRFSGSITGYQEGEIFFPYSPLLVVEGSFAEAVLLETLLLSILNYDSAVASAASRMTSAARGRACLEMGSRRAHEDAAIAAARATVVAGFAGTSNLAASSRYGIPAIGTAAHAFTLLHDSEEEAFAAQVSSLGVDTTLLVDTYNVIEGVKNAIKVAGTKLGAVRLDSGDLEQQAHQVRTLLDRLGARNTKIVVTSDLDEYAIASLRSAPVDSYGVGTRVVTGSGAPTSSMVYKLVAKEDGSGNLIPVEKKAEGKASVGGRKTAARRFDDAGSAVSELVLTGADGSVSQWRPDGDELLRSLHQQLVTNGAVDDRWCGRQGLETASKHHEAARQELPMSALRLSNGEPALPTIFQTLS